MAPRHFFVIYTHENSASSSALVETVETLESSGSLKPGHAEFIYRSVDAIRQKNYFASRVNAFHTIPEKLLSGCYDLTSGFISSIHIKLVASPTKLQDQEVFVWIAADKLKIGRLRMMWRILAPKTWSVNIIETPSPLLVRDLFLEPFRWLRDGYKTIWGT